MKSIKIVLLSLFSIMLGNVFAQTFPVYDSTQVAQSLTGTRDIRFNTQFHKNSGALQTLKGVSMGTFYKALKGKLVSEGLVSGGGQIDSIQIYHDSILIAYALGLVVDRDTIRIPTVIPTLGGDVTGTLGNVVVTDNSHNHNSTTITTDIVSSINGVSNDGGNIAIVGTNGISVSSNNTTDIITISGTASPYKVYTALLSQTTTGDPVATVLANTLSADIVWTRTSTGVYFGTLASAFTSGLTTVSCNYGIVSGTADIITGFRSNSNVIRVQTYRSDDSTLAEMEGSLIFIEIRVYIGA
jgi:hypothetical protein